MLDQKFGFALAGGQAAGAVKRVLDQPWLEWSGCTASSGPSSPTPRLYGAAIRQMIAADGRGPRPASGRAFRAQSRRRTRGPAASPETRN